MWSVVEGFVVPIPKLPVILALPSTLNPPFKFVVPTTLRFPATFKELEIFILPLTSTVSSTSVIKFNELPPPPLSFWKVKVPLPSVFKTWPLDPSLIGNL